LEAKKKLAELLDRVEQIPSESEAWTAIERLRERARKLMGGAFDWETFKADRDVGRPYDAAYLELAQRRGLQLATLDEYPRRAGSAEGIILLGKSQ
jgi:predicted nucleic acid-binding protein